MTAASRESASVIKHYNLKGSAAAVAVAYQLGFDIDSLRLLAEFEGGEQIRKELIAQGYTV